MSVTLRRRIVGIALILGTLLVAGSVTAVFLTVKSFADFGSALMSGVLSAKVSEQALPAGSALLLDHDTLATLVVLDRFRTANGKDSLRLFVGDLRAGSEQKLATTDKMVAIRQQEFTANQPEVMRLVAASSVMGRPPRGRLVLRATKDSSDTHTFTVY